MDVRAFRDDIHLMPMGIAVEFDTESEAMEFFQWVHWRYGVLMTGGVDIYSLPHTGKWYVSQYIRVIHPLRVKPEGQPFDIVRKEELHYG